MIIERERPVTVLIHPKLEYELKIRKEQAESVIKYPLKGGMLTYSLLAAFELETLRKSGEKIMQDVLKIKHVPTYNFELNGVPHEFVSYEIFKKLYIFTSILNKKKDTQQINIDVTKIRGCKKNEANIFW